MGASRIWLWAYQFEHLKHLLSQPMKSPLELILLRQCSRLCRSHSSRGPQLCLPGGKPKHGSSPSRKSHRTGPSGLQASRRDQEMNFCGLTTTFPWPLLAVAIQFSLLLVPGALEEAQLGFPARPTQRQAARQAHSWESMGPTC